MKYGEIGIRAGLIQYDWFKVNSQISCSWMETGDIQLARKTKYLIGSSPIISTKQFKINKI